MIKLLSEIIEAHGGIHRWRQFRKVEAQIISGGKLFDLKGFPQDGQPRKMTVWLHEQKASLHPFGGPDRLTSFTPGRIAIETTGGKVLSERTGSPGAFHEQMKTAQWDALDRAYFNGYALWMYLTTPFFMAMPGLQVKEIDPWQENKETWQGLSVTFPAHMATHSRVQEFYFGADKLIRRHDYQIDLAGTFSVAQFLYDLQLVQGFWVPSGRRAYKKDTTGKPVLEELIVGIDLSHFHFS